MTTPKRLLLLAVAAGATAAWGQPVRRDSEIGYLYPAGGQRGTTFEVLVGGQNLGGASGVQVSGGGVRASVLKHYRAIRNLNGDQRKALQDQLKELRDKRLRELTGREAPAKEAADQGMMKPEETETPPVALPEHPLLRELERKSLKQLIEIGQEFFNNWKRQPNAQIGETVLIEVTLDPEAALGDRELRLQTPMGLTNPRCLQVGLFPEAREQEPNAPLDFVVMPNLPKEPPLELPALMNGQVKPGDVDRFSFRAAKGQRLVIDTQARHLVPFLADAVPGWFQATVALYDANGKEVAFDDDYRFDPDPVLLFEVPEAGAYELEIRDSLYRGREDFVYRVSISERPFVTAMFPLGGQVGADTTASIEGWNLPRKQLRLSTEPGPEGVRQTSLNPDEGPVNPLFYAVDTLPECTEVEPNDTAKTAQQIALPKTVNGRVSKPGDVDVFQFTGRAGEEVVAEVLGRRLHSPIDSLVRLTDAAGRVLRWNDDHMDKEGHLHRDMGLLTHHADSYLRVKLPTDGVYFAHLADSQHQGGEAYGYRLRLSPPRPDFELRLSPSSLNVRAGMAAPVWVYALRKDGFEDEIELTLKDGPAGFRLDGGRIPPGCSGVCMTLTAPAQPIAEPASLQIEGRASIGGQTITRPAVPCEDAMQAFLWRHLAPSQQLLVASTGGRFAGPTFEPVEAGPVRIPQNGTVPVSFRTAALPIMQRLELEFKEQSEGLVLQESVAAAGRLTLQLKTKGEALKPGFAGNLIVEAFAEMAWGRKGGNLEKRRMSLGVLPAIPFEIVE
jgi:hypothetical protein